MLQKHHQVRRVREYTLADGRILREELRRKRRPWAPPGIPGGAMSRRVWVLGGGVALSLCLAAALFAVLGGPPRAAAASAGLPPQLALPAQATNLGALGGDAVTALLGGGRISSGPDDTLQLRSGARYFGWQRGDPGYAPAKQAKALMDQGLKAEEVVHRLCADEAASAPELGAPGEGRPQPSLGSNQDGLSPVTVTSSVPEGDPEHAVAAPPQRLVIAEATASVVGGPDSFRLALQYGRDATAEMMPAKLSSVAAALAHLLDARVGQAYTEPEPSSGNGSGGCLRLIVAFWTVPLRMTDLERVCDQLGHIADESGATAWKVVARRVAGVDVSDEMARQAFNEAKWAAGLASAAADRPLGRLHAMVALPTAKRDCLFEAGPGTSLAPPSGRDGGAAPWSAGTQVRVRVVASWEL
jgi:hypothetical protein